MKKPVLYLMLGYPGAGKTTTATIISELTGAVHLWADKIRSERYHNPKHSHQENLDLYNHLNGVTDGLLAEGKSVVFDTNFNFYKDRCRLREIAAKHGATTLLVWVTTPKEMAKTRATQQSGQQGTRVFGNMPESDFERISRNLEEPKPTEPALTISGTAISNTSVENLLTSAGVLPGS